MSNANAPVRCEIPTADPVLASMSRRASRRLAGMIGATLAALVRSQVLAAGTAQFREHGLRPLPHLSHQRTAQTVRNYGFWLA